MLTLLAVAAGCVDAASFLGLGQVMTAAMTGNTVLLGLALGQADAAGALRADRRSRGVRRRRAGRARRSSTAAQSGVVWAPAVTAALALELVVLVVLALAWHVLEGRAGVAIDYRYPLIAAAGIAMGLQSAAAQRIGVPGVATTYVTGTLTSMAARLVGWLRSSAAAPGDQARDAGAPWLQASVWIAYGAGAVFAGAAHFWWPGQLPSACRRRGEIRWSSGGPAAADRHRRRGHPDRGDRLPASPGASVSRRIDRRSG